MFPFARFPGTDPVLGPEMKSTGEVMGIDGDFAMAFAKAQLGAGTVLPMAGTRLHLGQGQRQGRSSSTPRAIWPTMGFDLSPPTAPPATSKGTALP